MLDPLTRIQDSCKKMETIRLLTSGLTLAGSRICCNFSLMSRAVAEATRAAKRKTVFIVKLN
jgi:hypothetical protein